MDSLSDKVHIYFSKVENEQKCTKSREKNNFCIRPYCVFIAVNIIFWGKLKIMGWDG